MNALVAQLEEDLLRLKIAPETDAECRLLYQKQLSEGLRELQEHLTGLLGLSGARCSV